MIRGIWLECIYNNNISKLATKYLNEYRREYIET